MCFLAIVQIDHVESILSELNDRKMRCDELADVRKLKLQQILQLRTSERDANQVTYCTCTYD